jgi:hypothetical protein
MDGGELTANLRQQEFNKVMSLYVDLQPTMHTFSLEFNKHWRVASHTK